MRRRSASNRHRARISSVTALCIAFVRLVSCLLTCFFPLAGSPALFGAESKHIEDSNSVSDSIVREVQAVFAQAREAVCKVRSVDRHGQLVGTGFFIDPMGTLVSTYSVAGESSEITVEYGNKKYAATRVLADSRSGLVLLKVETDSPFLPLASAEPAEVATPVVAVGYALDLDISPTFGTIAGYDIKYLGHYFPVRHIRASLPVLRGQAGSPLLNMRGRVVGMVVSSVDGGAACHALPATAIDKVASDYAAHGGLRPGWLGATVEPFVPSVDTSAPVVTDVAPDSPAKSAGLQPGDILVRIGNREIPSAPDAMDAAFYLKPGQAVDLVVRRDGDLLTLPATVSDHPASTTLQAHSLPNAQSSQPLLDTSLIQLGN